MTDYNKFLVSEVHTGFKDSTELTPRDLREITRDGRSPWPYSIHTDGCWGSETINVSIIFGDDSETSSHYSVTFEPQYNRETESFDTLSQYEFTDVYGVIPEYVAKAQAKLAINMAKSIVDCMDELDDWDFEEGYGYYKHFK